MTEEEKKNTKKSICDRYNIELSTFDRWMDSYGLEFVRQGEDQEFSENEILIIQGHLEKLFNTASGQT
jgi:hypothetical protein